MTMTTRYSILRDLATRGFDTGRECREILTEVDTLRDQVRHLRRLAADDTATHETERVALVAERDRLRAQLDAPRSLCGECGGFLVLRCEHCGTVHGDAPHCDGEDCDGEDCADPIYADDGTHSPLCSIRVADEIAEVAEMITCGHPTCNAVWRDTEARGWLWYCSLPHGHDGSHRCIGASW